MRSILNRTQVDAEQIDQAVPSITYKSLSGHNLHITYDGNRTVNGEQIRYDQWPLIRNPYMDSVLNSGILKLSFQGQQLILNYKSWTKSIIW
ncbi:hypothetical protein D3C73_1035750 [compost metagenome]